MLVTDSNILKSFSKEFGPPFKIGDSHAQGIYKKPLDMRPIMSPPAITVLLSWSIKAGWPL